VVENYTNVGNVRSVEFCGIEPVDPGRLLPR